MYLYIALPGSGNDFLSYVQKPGEIEAEIAKYGTGEVLKKI